MKNDASSQISSDIKDKNDILKAEQKTWSIMRRTQEYMEQVLLPLAKKYGLTFSQLRTVCYIHRMGEATVGAIAKGTGVLRTNASTMCKKLCEMGFLKRYRLPNDERCVKLTLTEKGLNTAKETEKQLVSNYMIDDKDQMMQELETAMRLIQSVGKRLGLDVNEEEPIKSDS